jgi:FSR family fosmidomycin resistance protein-like MFS transporter
VTALVGTALALAALVALGWAPALVVVVIAGVGNALFHLGGGAISLSLDPERATPSGMFVAPGALGLAAGVWIGHRPTVTVVPLALALLAGFAAQKALPSSKPSPARDAARGPERKRVGAWSVAGIALGLLVLTVFVRSLVGGGASHGLPRSVALSFALAASAFVGKFVGGVVADRLGWTFVSVAALLLSLPLLVFGEREVWCIVAGVGFFQMTMPVTVSAAALLLPGRPATAFGLCCLALVLGASPLWFHSVAAWLQRGSVFAALIVLSALGLLRALRSLETHHPRRASSGRIGIASDGPISRSL